MRIVEVAPVRRVRGTIQVPGDKSISHRLAMLGAVAIGPTTIEGFSPSADCENTLGCLRGLGISVERQGDSVHVDGGLDRFRACGMPLDAGNSGTTIRLLAGILAGRPFESMLTGDGSLSRRPMKRIIEPLRRFGAELHAREDNFLPLRVRGGQLRGIEYVMPVASAQVKSAVLLAGLQAEGHTIVREPLRSRNHTEIALSHFGAEITSDGASIRIAGGRALQGRACRVPGDLSSAAFLIAATLLCPDSELRLNGVGINPTRAGFLRLIEEMGARVEFTNTREFGLEPVADIVVRSSVLEGGEVPPELVPNVIDEIPVLAVLAPRTRRGISVRGAAELRVKESDRIAAIAANLKALGIEIDQFPDGFSIPGNQLFRGGSIDSMGDHRIAMAFAITGLISETSVAVLGPECVDVSFPGFFDVLSSLQSR